jgi:ABC-type dipeptide/oligopeptide/nickel transport system permease subunit
MFGTDQLGADLLAALFATRSLSRWIFVRCRRRVDGGIFGLTAAFLRADRNLLMEPWMSFSDSGTLMDISVVSSWGQAYPQLILATAISNGRCFAKPCVRPCSPSRQRIYRSRAFHGAKTFRLMSGLSSPTAWAYEIFFVVASVAGTSCLFHDELIGLVIQPPTPEWGSLCRREKYIASYSHMLCFRDCLFSSRCLSFSCWRQRRDALDQRLN